MARTAGRAGGPVSAQRLYLTSIPSLSVRQSGRFPVWWLLLQPLEVSAWGPGDGAPPPACPVLVLACPPLGVFVSSCVFCLCLVFEWDAADVCRVVLRRRDVWTVRLVGGSLIVTGGEIPSLPPLVALFRDPKCPSVPPLQELQGNAAGLASSGGGFEASLRVVPGDLSPFFLS